LAQAEAATGEASAMEAAGMAPIMVKGELSNVKLTDYNQLPVIKAYLQRQGRL
jgi:2-C-methyl-D-erythritol 4-phosphate cytidylyltransferase